MSTVWTFLTVLPELWKLIQAIEKGIEQAETDQKVADNLKAVKAAFDAKDSSKLDTIFNSK